MVQIEHNIPKLLYRQIVEWMEQQLMSGAWPEHYKLKPEIELAAELGVNRGTVRKAIGELIVKGRLVRIHGRGTFVASATLEQPLAERLVAFSEDLIEKKIPFETRVLEQAVTPPSQQVASLLALPSQAKVFVLKRVRIVAQVPLILLHNYVAYDCCPGIESIDFVYHRLFETLEKRFGLDVDWGRRTFQAQSADDTVAAHLNISRCDPVMYLEQLVYLRNGSPVEFSNVWIRGDRFRLSANVKRNTLRDSPSSSNEYL
jgi:DNA-binding GntR family transcriptional regulator